jgi:hypothetical protein
VIPDPTAAAKDWQARTGAGITTWSSPAPTSAGTSPKPSAAFFDLLRPAAAPDSALQWGIEPLRRSLEVAIDTALRRRRNPRPHHRRQPVRRDDQRRAEAG